MDVLSYLRERLWTDIRRWETDRCILPESQGLRSETDSSGSARSLPGDCTISFLKSYNWAWI